MNFDEFVCAMLECTKKKLQFDEQAEVQRVTKNNGTVKVGISLRKQGETVAPLFYMEEFYLSYQNGETIDVLTDFLVEKSRAAAAVPQWDYEEMFDFFRVKEKICFKLINTERNRELLKTVPHFEVLDFSVVFYLNILIDDSESGSVIIKNDFLNRWQVTTSVLYECAKENMQKCFPVILRPLSEFLPVQLSEEHRSDPVLVLTNEAGSYGAASILYKGIPGEIFRQVGENYYLLPASVHEFLVVPESIDIPKERLTGMVREINATQILPEEVLSDDIYYFNGNNITKM